jgi:hypothetical protein
MSFAGAGWSNLLQNKWPVFGILRRIRDHLLRTLEGLTDGGAPDLKVDWLRGCSAGRCLVQ